MGLKKNENYCIMQLSKKCKNEEGIRKNTEFYMGTTKILKSKKIHICKDCIRDYVYDEEGVPNTEKLKDILRMCDYPFLKDTWNASFNDKSMESIGAYFKNIYLNFKNKTWKDSDNINLVDDVGIHKPNFKENNHDDYELIKMWGKGYTVEELHWLEEYYSEWKTKHDLSELSVQRLVKRICINELKLRRAEESGDSTEKLDKSLMELMEKASLTPKNLKGTQENDSQRAWGLFIGDIEKYKPAEYFNNKELYKDHDGLLDYFRRFILRPMRNLLCNNREFDKEYNIEKEPDVNDIDYGVDEDGIVVQKALKEGDEDE